MSRKDSLKSTATHSSNYLIASIVSFAISLLTLPIYTRLMSPSDFGISLMFIVLGKIVIGFVNFNLHYSTYRYYFDFTNDIKEFKILNSSNLLFLAVISLLTIAIFYFIPESFNAYLFEGKLNRELIMLAVISGFLDYFFLYFTTILTAQQKSLQFAFIAILSIILNALFSIFFMVEFKLTYIGRCYGIISSQIVILAIVIWICRNTLSYKFSLPYLRKSLRLTFPMIPQMALGLSQNYLDKTLLTVSKGGTAAVGNYTLGANFANVLKTLMDSIEKAWSPFFFKKASENTESSKVEIVEKFFALAFIYMILGLSVIYFSEEAIKLLTTKAYYSSIYVVPIYVYFYLFAIFGYLSNAQLSIAEKFKYILPGSFAGAIVNITFNFLLIPKYGIIGAAVASALTGLTTQIFLFYFGMKSFPLPINIKKIILMYVVLILYTLLFYPLAYFEINFVVKILLKLLIIGSFILFGIWKNVIQYSLISSFIETNKFLNILVRNRNNNCNRL